MRPDHWWAHPFNRRRARHAGGVGTVIAATAAGLIAGLTQHHGWTQATPSITNAAVNNPTTPLDTAPAPPDHAAVPADTASPVVAPVAVPTAANLPPAPGADARIALVAPGSAVPSPPRQDRVDAQTPSAATTGPPSLAAAGTAEFTPYTRSAAPIGAPSVSSALPAAPASNTVTTSATAGGTSGQPDSAGQPHTPALTKPPVAAVPEKRKHAHGDYHADANTGDQDSDHNASHPASSGADGNGSSAIAADAAAGGTQDSQTRSRIASALPPGFTPSQPRQPAPASGAPGSTWPAAATPSTSPTWPIAAPAGSAAPPVTDNGFAASAPSAPVTTAPLTSQYPQATQAAGSPSGFPGVVPQPGGSLTRVQCPAAVAEATCYQQQPSPGQTGTAPASTPPATNPASATATPSQASGASPVPAPGGLRIGDSSGPSASGWSCQGSPTEPSTVRLRNWSDLGQLIRDRLQQCMAEAMNHPTDWNTSSPPTHTLSTPESSKDSTSSNRAKKHGD